MTLSKLLVNPSFYWEQRAKNINHVFTACLVLRHYVIAFWKGSFSSLSLHICTEKKCRKQQMRLHHYMKVLFFKGWVSSSMCQTELFITLVEFLTFQWNLSLCLSLFFYYWKTRAVVISAELKMKSAGGSLSVNDALAHISCPQPQNYFLITAFF